MAVVVTGSGVDRGFAARLANVRAWLVAAVLGILLSALVAVLLDARGEDQVVSTPSDNSVAAGFARDMSVHHAQAVEMAELIRTRTDNPDIRQLAVDIVLTQQAQLGQMRGWLDVWGLRPTRTGPAMAWMDMPTSGAMPGMASRTQRNELATASGERADEIFLNLMIEHHKAGVAMAREAIQRSNEDVVERLAGAIARSQAAEQRLLEQMLAEVAGRTAQDPSNREAGTSHEGDH